MVRMSLRNNLAYCEVDQLTLYKILFLQTTVKFYLFLQATFHDFIQ